MKSDSGMQRRQFVRGLGATAIAGVAVGQAQAFSLQNPRRAEGDPRATGQTGRQFAMVIDLRKCVGCQACTGACKTENRVERGHFRTWVTEHERGSFPMVHKVFLPQLCNHCAQPSCVGVCPTGATFKRQDGVVVVDDDICWGCGYCISACPYDKRFFDPVSRTVDKCTLCAHRLDSGLLPACVETCVGGARIAGDLGNPASEVSQLVASFPTNVLQPQQGTRPQVFYIELDGSVQGALQGATVDLDDRARMIDGQEPAEWQLSYPQEV